MGIRDISEPQREQIRNMTKDGKKPKEIIAYFGHTYEMTITGNQIWFVVNKTTPGSGAGPEAAPGVDKSPEKKPRKYKKRAKAKNPRQDRLEDVPKTPDEIITEIKLLLDELARAHQNSITEVRQQLIDTAESLRDK